MLHNTNWIKIKLQFPDQNNEKVREYEWFVLLAIVMLDSSYSIGNGVQSDECQLSYVCVEQLIEPGLHTSSTSGVGTPA